MKSRAFSAPMSLNFASRGVPLLQLNIHLKSRLFGMKLRLLSMKLLIQRFQTDVIKNICGAEVNLSFRANKLTRKKILFFGLKRINLVPLQYIVSMFIRMVNSTARLFLNYRILRKLNHKNLLQI